MILIVRDKSQDNVHKPQLLNRKEIRGRESNRHRRFTRLSNALPLGQTGLQVVRFVFGSWKLLIGKVTFSLNLSVVLISIPSLGQLFLPSRPLPQPGVPAPLLPHPACHTTDWPPDLPHSVFLPVCGGGGGGEGREGVARARRDCCSSTSLQRSAAHAAFLSDYARSGAAAGASRERAE